MIERLPPQNIDAEQSALGSMMIDKNALSKGIELLTGSDFYRPTHQTIFDALNAMSFRREPADLITLQEELKKHGKLEDVGGTEYLMALVETVPTAANVEHYANIVRDKSIRRTAIAKATEIIGLAHDQSSKIDVSDLFIKSALSISDRGKAETRSMLDVCMAANERLTLIAKGGDPRVIPFRLATLQRRLRGAGPGNLIFFVGPTGGGKTVCLLDALDSAGELKRPTLYNSLEMDGEDLVNRMMCSHTMQDMDDIHDGHVNWDLSIAAYGELSQYPVTLIETAATLRKLELTARRWKIANQEAIDKYGGMFIIDYFGIIRFDERAGNETEAQGEIARRLKMLARELNVPIITALQLRKPPAGQKQDAGNNDARGSGAILNEADKVIFIKPINEADDDTDGKQDVDLVITKNRGGKMGRIHTIFDRKHSRFFEVEEHRLPSAVPTTYSRIANYDDRFQGGNN